MSTIKTTNITHGSNSSTANFVLTSGGDVTVGNDLTVTDTLTVPTKKLVCPGMIVQVLQAFKDDTYTRTSDGTSTTIPGLSQAITMTAASNKVYCMAQVQVTCGGNYGGHVLNLARGSTKISQAESNGSRTLGSVCVTANSNYPHSHVINYLDTPGAGTHTYTVQDYDPSSSNVIYVNRPVTHDDDAGYQNTTSSLILMEVAA